MSKSMAIYSKRSLAQNSGISGVNYPSIFKRVKNALMCAGILLVILLSSPVSSYGTYLATLAGGGTAAQNVYPGQSSVVLYSFSLANTGSTADNLTAFTFTTTGTATSADVSGFTVFINNTNSLSGAAALLGGYITFTGTGSGSFAYTCTPFKAPQLAATTGIYYIFLVANFTTGATAGRTIAVNQELSTSLTMTTTYTTVTNTCTAGNAATIIASGCSQYFAYTGAAQTYTVPLGCTSLSIKAAGGSGGANSMYTDIYVSGGGLGGIVSASVSVTSGSVYSVTCGGFGASASSLTAHAAGGYNGGGAGGITSGSYAGGGGGGASDVRNGAYTAGGANLLVVAGGGGGAGLDINTFNYDRGGAGGSAAAGGSGGNGYENNVASANSGGTQSAGGAGTLTGALNNGASGITFTTGPAGGGAGGYYGGGLTAFYGGGGGSSFVAGAASATATYTQGGNPGYGYVIITPLVTIETMTSSGSLCTAGGGATIGLGGSEVGWTYQLYNGASTVGSAVTGTGSSFNFGTSFATAGTYSVLATQTCSGVTTAMSGSITITANPNVSSWTSPTASTSCSGFGNTITVNSSSLAAGTYTVTYSLSGGTTYSGTAVLTMGSGGTGTFPTAALSGASSTTATITQVTNSTGCSSSVSSSNTVSFSVSSSPTLIAGTGVTESNIASNPITYGTGATGSYYTTITSITAQLGSGTVNTLVAGTDYSVTATGITLIPTLSDHYLTTPGSYNLVVYTSGSGCSSSSSLTQAIAAGTATSMSVTTTPVASSSAPAMSTQPVLTFYDLYGNVATGYTTAVTAAASGSTWTIGGTTSSTPSGGVANTFAMTATYVSSPYCTVNFTSGSFSASASFSIPVPSGTATTWYTKTSSSYADLSLLSSWTSDASGGAGATPFASDFTTANRTWDIYYGTSPSLASSLTLAGTVNIGNGTSPITFSTTSSYYLSGTVNVAAGATLDLFNATLPTLGTLASTSTLIFDGAANYTTFPTTNSGTAETFGNVIFNTTGTTAFTNGATTFTINGNFIGEGSGTTGTNGVVRFTGNGSTANPGYIFNISGNFTAKNAAQFDAQGSSAAYTPKVTFNVSGNDSIVGAASIWNQYLTTVGTANEITFNLVGTSPQNIVSSAAGYYSVANLNVTSGATAVVPSGTSWYVTDYASATNYTSTTVLSGGTLQIGASGSIYDQYGTRNSPVTIASGGTLMIADPLGIVNSGTGYHSFGNVSSLSFSTGGNYIFNGTAAQVTGTNFAAISLVSPGSFTCNNAAGVTATNAVTIGSGASLNLQNGTLSTTNLAFVTGANVYVDNGGFSATPSNYGVTGYGINLFYSNLGNNNLTVNTGSEWPAAFTGNVTVNKPSATITLSASKALNTLTAGYGGLTLTSGTLACGSSNISLTGNWTNNAGSSALTAGSGSISFNGSAAQTIGGSAVTTFNTLNINNAAGVTFNVSPSATTTMASGSTVQLQNGALTLTSPLSMSSGSAVVRDNGTFAATPGGYSGISLSYQDLGAGASPTVANEWPATFTGTVTVNKAGTVTLNGTKTLTGSILLTNGTLAAAGYGISLTGNWTNNSGTSAFTPGIGTVTMNGAGSSLGGTFANTFYNLTLGAAATLGSNATVTNTLALGGNILSTGANSITCPGNVPVTLSTGGYVTGNLYKTLVGGGPYNYEVGAGGNYSPASLAVTGSPVGSIGVNVTHGAFGSVGTSGIDGSNDVNDYWTVTDNTSVHPTAVAPTFSYQSGDIGGGTNSAYFAQLYASGTWGSVISGLTNSMITTPPSSVLPGSASYAGTFIMGNHPSTAGLSMTADFTPPTVDNANYHPITFTDDGVWAENFTSVTAQRTGSSLISTLVSGTDYLVNGPAGTLSLTPTSNGKLDTSGTYTISVYATGYTGSTVSQVLNNGAANHLTMATQPVGPATNGGTLATQPVVNIVDQYGNATPSSAIVTASVTASSGSWTLGGTSLSATASSGTATFSGLTATSAGPVGTASLTFTAPSLSNTVSATFSIVAPAPPAISYASGVTVDNAFSVTYIDNPTWDALVSGITITGATGGPHSLTGAYSVGTGSITLTPSASVYLQTAGTYTISVAATGYTASTFVQTIGIGAAAKMIITTQPTAPSYNGGTLGIQPVVNITDQYGNAETGSSAVVTAAVGSGSWTLGGPSPTATAAAGVATFSNLTATSVSAVTGATIQFTSPGLTTTVSATFNIPSPPSNYYNIAGSGNLAATSAWTTDPVGAAAGSIGSGTNPANFTTASQAFNIVNSSLPTITGAWTVSGLGSYIVVGNGSTTINFSDGGNAITGTINVNANATLTIASTTVPTFGSLSTLSTVVFSGSGTQAIPATSYGNLTYSGSGTGSLATGTYNIAGNYTQSSGTVQYTTASVLIWNVTGNFSLNGGTFDFNTATGSSSTMYVYGNMTLATGTTLYNYYLASYYLYGNYTRSGTSSVTGYYYYVNFFFSNTASSLASPQHFNENATGTTSYIEYWINPNVVMQLDANDPTNSANEQFNLYGGTLNMQGYVISGTGIFIMNTGSTLYTAHAQGISTTAATGCVQVTGTKTFTAGTTNYVYNGTSAQVTGNALPVSFNSGYYLTINNAAGVTLTNTTTTFNTGSYLKLQNGTLTNTAANLVMGGGQAPFLYADAGHLSTTPTSYTPILTYTNLGQNQTAFSSSTSDWPASGFAGSVNLNYSGATFSLNGSKSMSTTTGGLTLTAGILDVTSSNYGITTTGSWTNNAGTSAFVARSGTVTFTGSAAATIGGTYGTTFNTLTLNNTAGVTLSAATTFASGTTLNLQQGTFINGSNLSMASGSNVNVDKGSLNTAPATYSGVNLTYTSLGTGGSITTSNEWPSAFTGNVTINKTGNTITLGGGKAVTGNVTLTAGTLATSNNALSLTGLWTNNSGTTALTPGTTSVTFNGTSVQSVTGTYATPFSGLTLNNSAGLAINLNTTLTGTLTLTNGILSTGSNMLIMATAPGTVSRTTSTTSNYVNGTLLKSINGSSTINYEVGDGGSYVPVSIALQAAGSAGGIAVQSTGGHTPAYASASIDGTYYVDHYWTISSPTIAATTFSVAAAWTGTMTPTFTYNNADIGGGSNTGWVAQVYSTSGTPGWEPVVTTAVDLTGNTTAVPSGTSSSAGTYGYYIVGLNDANTPPTFTAATGVTEDNAATTPATFTGLTASGPAPSMSDWNSHVTLVTAKGPSGVLHTLTGGGTDYAKAVSGTSGTFSLIPTASDNYLTTAGTYTINISSIGYTTATFVQTITAGAPTTIAIVTQPTAPSANPGTLGTVPVVSMADQYGNTASGSATITGNAIAGTVGATTVVASWTAGSNIQAGSSPITFTGFTASSYGPVTGAKIQFTGTVGSSTVALTPITSNSFNLPSPGAPALTAAAGATVDNPFNITYTDNPTWDAAITGITVNGSTLSPTAYSVGTGSITLTPSLSTLLQTPGTYSIVVAATGFTPSASTSQTIAAGVGAKLVMSVQPTAPSFNGGALGTQPVVIIKDHYGNATTSGAAVTAGSSGGTTSWTLGGTTTVNGVSGTVTYSGLTASSTVPEVGATLTFSITSTYGTYTVVSSSFNIPNPPITYYDITGTSVDLSQLSSWTTNTSGGSGTSPINFTSNSQVFVVKNGTTPTLTHALTISGIGSYINVGDGSTSVNFSIPSGFAYTGTINGTTNSILTIGNTTMPTLGTFNTGSTVVFNGTSQTIPVAASYSNLTFSGTTGSVGTGTLTVGGTCSVTASTLTVPTSGVLKISGDLDVTGGTLTNAGTGSISLLGNLNVSGTGAITGSTANTLNFTNTSTSQAINWTSSGSNAGTTFNVNSGCSATLSAGLPLSSTAAFTLNGTLVASTYGISGSGAFTITSLGTLNTASTTGLNGTITTSGTKTFNSGASYVFSAASAITTPWVTASNWTTTSAPKNVTISNAVAMTNNASFNPSGTLTIPSGATLDLGTYSLGGSPTVSNSGTVKTASTSGSIPAGYTWGGVVSYTGAGAQTLVNGTYNNLNIANTSGGVSLASSVTVNTLTLTSGNLTLGSYNLTIPAASAVAGSPGSSSMIVPLGTGSVIATFTMNGSYTYPVGDGANYTPITLNVTGTSYTSANMGMNMLNTEPALNHDVTNYIKRSWTVLPSGISGLSYTATATYVAPGDVVGIEANIAMGKYSTALPWTIYGLESGHVLTSGAVNIVGSTTFSGINSTYTVTASGSDTICGSGSRVLTGSVVGGAPTLSYAWSPSAGLSSTVGSSVTASPATTTVYSVTVTDGNGLTSVGTATVTVETPPTITATVTPNPICNGDMLYLNATPAGGSGSYTGYAWAGPNSYTSTVQNATLSAITTAEAGTYTVTVTDNLGCTASVVTASVTITPNQWAGGTSTAWSNAANWTCGFIPTATQNAIIPGSGSYTNAPTLDVSESVNNLTINSTAAVTLASGKTLTVYGNMTNNAAVSGSGVVYLGGSSSQALSGTGTVSNLTLANSAGATINTTSDTVGITGTLLLNSGTLTTNGNLMLVSNSGGSGSIGQITGGSISGNVIMQQYVPGGRRAYRFIAHPFNASIPLSQIQNYIDITGTGGSANGFTTTTSNAASAFWYNTAIGNSALGNDPGWTAYTSTNGSGSNAFNKNEGIRLYFRGAKGTGLDGSPYVVAPVTYRTWGAVNTGAQSITLVKGTGANEDYNTIGNPYPAITDIGSVINTASTGGLLTGAAFYIFNPYLGTSGQFVTETIGGSYYLGANESFQVRTTANGNTLSFAESNKGTAVTDALMRTASNDYLTLYIYDNSYHPWDLLHINFNDAATDNEDSRYDGAKPPSPASLNFYSLSADNSKLSIDARPFNEGKAIPLGIKSSYLQDFIIKAQNVAVPDGNQVYLHDKYLQTYTQLQQGTEYKFTISKDAASQGDGRFELSMRKAGAAIAQTAKVLDVQMVPNPATSMVTVTYNAPSKVQTTVRVMDAEGVTVMTQDLGIQQSGSTQISLDKFAAGVYLVEVTSGTQKVVNRLVKE